MVCAVAVVYPAWAALSGVVRPGRLGVCAPLLSSLPGWSTVSDPRVWQGPGLAPVDACREEYAHSGGRTGRGEARAAVSSAVAG